MTHQDYARAFWKKVDIARSRKGISWNQLCISIGFSYINICRYRKNGSIPYAYTIVQIADVLDCSTDELLR